MTTKRLFQAVAAAAALCIPSICSFGEEVTKAVLGNVENTANVVTDVAIPGSRVWYGTCTIAQGTTAKTVTTTTGDFELKTGSTVYVMFTSANTASTPTLNVDGKGAKTIRKYGTMSSSMAYFWRAGEVVGFVYDGTKFDAIKGGYADTTYYGITKLSSSYTGSSTDLAANEYAVGQAYSTLNSAIDSKTTLSGNNGGWTCVPSEYDGNQITLSFVSVAGGWQPFANGTAIGAPLGTSTSSSITWAAGDFWSGSVDLVATRDPAQYYVLGSQSDAKLASYDYVTNAMSSSGNYHVNSYVTEMDPSDYTLTCTNGSYSVSNGRLTWLFDGSSSVMNTRPAAGFYTITVTSSGSAITGIAGERCVSSFDWGESMLPKSAPIDISIRQTSNTSYELTAHVVAASEAYAATNGYFAYIDGFDVLTYDKPGYVAYSVTNDAAGIVTKVDTIDIGDATGSDARLVANAEAVRRYTRDQLLESMRSGEFWHYSPDGKMSPDPSRVIIDQEVMFMGRFTYLTAGGMVAISADEGVSSVATTGSVFRIGMFGNRDIEISGDERQLHISSFTLDNANDEWVIVVTTNFMENPNLSPVIRTVTNMSYIYDGTIMWQTLDITGTKSGDTWTFRVPNESDDKIRFFSAWAIQGEKKVHIGPKLELGTGQIVIDGNVFQPMEITIGDVTLEVLGRVKE